MTQNRNKPGQPNIVLMVADDFRYRDLVKTFCDKIQKFQQNTRDPWLHKWTYE